MKSTILVHPQHGRVARSTLLLILASETVLFGTLVMSYLYFRTGGSEMVFHHPQPLDVLIESLNTLILLGSVFFAWSANRSIQANRITLLPKNLMITVFLGAIFIFGQIFEFSRSGMHVNDSTFGEVFFALISFHAVHVLVGVTVLVLNIVRTRLGDFSVNRHDAITVGTWFWYYVAAVWLILFTVLYLV